MRRALAILIAAFLWTPAVALSQSICHDDETPDHCLIRVIPKGVPPALADDESKASEATAKKTETPGLDEVAGLGSSLKDFLPLLRFSGALGETSQDQNTGVVTVALNTRMLNLAGLSKDPSLQLKAKIDTRPALYGPLKEKLPAATRDDVEKQLVADKNRQNVTLEGSYNITSRSLGRAFAQYQALFVNLVQAAGAPLALSASAYGQEIAALEDVIISSNEKKGMDPTMVVMTDVPELTRRRFESQLNTDLTTGVLNYAVGFNNAVKQAGLNLFGQLVNNQPQLYVTGSRTFRDPLFGPTITTGRVTLEIGLSNNLNAFRVDAAHACDTNAFGADAGRCLAAYQRFVQSPSTQANIKAGTRLSLFAEFSSQDIYNQTLTAQSVTLTLPASISWSAGGDIGRLIAVQDDGTASARIDGSFRYEHPATTSAANERFVASVLLTKKIGELSVPFGLVYANKPEYLKDIDHQLSVNVGLRFNLFKDLTTPMPMPAAAAPAP